MEVVNINDIDFGNDFTNDFGFETDDTLLQGWITSPSSTQETTSPSSTNESETLSPYSDSSFGNYFPEINNNNLNAFTFQLPPMQQQQQQQQFQQQFPQQQLHLNPFQPQYILQSQLHTPLSPASLSPISLSPAPLSPISLSPNSLSSAPIIDPVPKRKVSRTSKKQEQEKTPPKPRKRDRVSDIPDEALPPEQLAKRMKRRERNKVAAQQSRTRKQMKVEELETIVDNLTKENLSLHEYINKLQIENSSLRSKLQVIEANDPNIYQQQQHEQQQEQINFSAPQQSFNYSLSGILPPQMQPFQYAGTALLVVALIILMVTSGFSSYSEQSNYKGPGDRHISQTDKLIAISNAHNQPSYLSEQPVEEDPSSIEDIIQICQTHLPRTQFEHRYGAQHFLHSIEYIKQYGQPGVQYIISPEAHSITLLDDDNDNNRKEIIKVSNTEENNFSRTIETQFSSSNPSLPSKTIHSPISLLLPAGILADNTILTIKQKVSEFSLDNINLSGLLSANITRYRTIPLTSNLIEF